jgi:hypothetical protein
VSLEEQCFARKFGAPVSTVARTSTFPATSSEITSEWLTQVLVPQELRDSGVKISSFELCSVGEVVGFAGSSTRVGKITYEGDVGKYQLPQTVFAKFALPADNTFRSFFAGAGMYKREIVCYNQLLPASPTAHPQFFFAEYDDTTHDFALVLRDMSDRMYCRDVPAC